MEQTTAQRTIAYREELRRRLDNVRALTNQIEGTIKHDHDAALYSRTRLEADLEAEAHAIRVNVMLLNQLQRELKQRALRAVEARCEHCNQPLDPIEAGGHVCFNCKAF